MKSNVTYILFGVFVVLAVAVYFLLRSPGEREASYSVSDVHLALDSAQVQSVTIKWGANTFSLQDIGGRWQVVKNAPVEWRYPADEFSVKQLLGSLHRLKVVSLISSNPEKQNLFQVDSTGTILSLTERGGTTTEFIVGKSGPAFSETYVRPAASNNVYLAEGLSPWEVNKEVRDWRDKTILNVPQDSIRSITYRYPKDEFTIVRDSLWRIKKDTVSSNTMKGLLTALSSLRAEDFVDSTLHLSKSQLKLDLLLPDPVTLTFSPMPPDSAKYWVVSSATAQIFVMNKWSVQTVLKQRKDFLPQKK